jgi:hypothetical protein
MELSFPFSIGQDTLLVSGKAPIGLSDRYKDLKCIVIGVIGVIGVGVYHIYK